MKNRVEGLVRQYRTARKRRLRFEAMVTALSVLVTGGVFWQLRRYGTAISDVPAAELPENGIPVVETDADPPDGTAGSGMAEEPEDWEAALPAFTDESAQQRIAAIAVSQLGYAEGSGGVLTADDGQTRTGYTRYGAWYGNPYGEWNTMFTYFCMYYAGVEKTEVPYGSGCWAWYETLDSKSMIAAGGNEKTGDIIFLDMDADGEPDRTGIVSDTAETEAGLLLSAIEGNCDGAVASRQYLSGIPEILGVLSVGDYVTEEAALTEYSGETVSGIQVAAQAAAGIFPEGTVMQAADVSDDEAMQAAADTLGGNADIREAVAVDISFYDADGNELEPAEGGTVSVQIILPEEKQLPEGDCKLLHIDSEGGGTVLTDADVAADGAAFETDAFSVYIMASTGQTAGDYYNGETIHLNLGESITLRVEVDTPNTYFKLYDSWDSTAGKAYMTPNIHNDEQVHTWGENQNYIYYSREIDATDENGEIIRDENDDPVKKTVYHNEVTFTANCPTPEGSTFRIHSPNGDEFPVVIAPSAEKGIMVNSATGYKSSDRIREWLGKYNGTTYGLSFPYNFGMKDVDGYVPNSKERPYLLMVGETMDFYVDSDSAGDSFVFTFEDGEGGTLSDLADIEQSSGSTHHAVTLTGTNPGMVHAVMPETGDEMWIKVMDRVGSTPFSQPLNHADMEIADGGTYTVSSTRVEGGQTIVDVKVYQADVVFVNDAYIYDKEGRAIQHYTSEFDPAYPLYRVQLETNEDGSLKTDENGRPIPKLDADGNTIKDETVPLGDYEQFGVPGGTQYEMTSAWIANISSKAYKKTYDAMDSDTAEFDVNLHLTPRQKYSYKVNPDGSLTQISEDPNWQAEPEERENIVFLLNHQEVIDARNKCPVNNGLDFTARAEFTALEMPVEKKLLNGTIEDQQFTFDVIDLNPTPLTSTRSLNNQAVADAAPCDAEGHAVLKNMRFFEAGTYYFELKEHIPENQNGIGYDDKSFYFKVKVSKDNDKNFLTAVPIFLKDNGSGHPESFEPDTEHTDTVFTNYKGYELPSTGGSGILPYLAGGILIISAASVLLLIRRRKEEETNS